MAVRIRFARGGTRNNPFYSVVVANSSSPRDGKYIEKIGYYNPSLKDGQSNDSGLARFVISDIERLKYWVGNGALPSDKLAKLCVKHYSLDFMNKFITPYKVTELDGKTREERKKILSEKAEAEEARIKEKKAKLAAESAA